MQTKKFRESLTKVLLFSILFVVILAFSSQDLFNYVVLNNLPIENIKHLLAIHILANTFLLTSLVGSSYILMKLYKQFEPKKLPFIGYLWIYAGFMLFIAAIFFFSLLNVWRTYYWIDGIIRLIAGIFGIGGFATLIKGYKYIINFKSAEDYKELADEIQRLRDIEDEIKGISTDKKP